MKPTSLYRLRDNTGRLLYVGIAGNPGRRFEQHRGEKPWWGDVAIVDVEHFGTREEALAAELKAIREEGPIHNIAGASRRGTVEHRNLIRAPYNMWRYRNKDSDRERTTPLVLVWEVDGSAMSDDYDPLEYTAYDLWRRWLTRLEERMENTRDMSVLWLVDSEPSGLWELAPFHQEPEENEDFLTEFTWPRHIITGERCNWLRLPVVDYHWNPHQADKGGFIQEVTGWKPSPLQPSVNLDLLINASRLLGMD